MLVGGGGVNEHWRSPTAASVGVEINFLVSNGTLCTFTIFKVKNVIK